ncbi:MAG: amidase family protein [Erysipelotrichaceae bacterium]|nr:amidase family protein [Erysipelotrichaceae bacterium]
MRLQDCTTNSATLALEILKKNNEKLNNIVTFVEPTIKGEGKLNNVPVVLKDNVNTKGILTTASCKILDNYVPVYNATIVDKIEKAGGQIIAKASMDELAMGGTNLTALTGPVKNPYDLNRISGGSSGGSAVAVASGAVPFAIGSDTGDSVRKPASFNGIVGVKPTYGRISRYGIIPYSSSLDHVGYFCTNVKDAATLLEVLAGRDDNDMTSSFEEVKEYSKELNSDIKGKKILVFSNVIEAISNKDVIESFNNLIEGLKKKGAIVENVSFDEKLMRAILPTYYIIANAEATANHSNLTGLLFGERLEGSSIDEIMIKSRSEGFGPWIKKRFVIGSYALKEDNQERVFRKAQKIRRLIVEDVMKKLSDADGLIAPAATGGAPLINSTSTNQMSDEYLVADNHMVIGNFTGCPSITLPMGYTEGLPIGVNLTCNPFKEQTMFDISFAIEEITGLADKVKEDF